MGKSGVGGSPLESVTNGWCPLMEGRWKRSVNHITVAGSHCNHVSLMWHRHLCQVTALPQTPMWLTIDRWRWLFRRDGHRLAPSQSNGCHRQETERSSVTDCPPDTLRYAITSQSGTRVQAAGLANTCWSTLFPYLISKFRSNVNCDQQKLNNTTNTNTIDENEEPINAKRIKCWDLSGNRFIQLDPIFVFKLILMH